MELYVYLNRKNHIAAINEACMEGNSGWVKTTEEALLQHTGKTLDALKRALTDGGGRCLYAFDGGSARLLTEGEREAAEQDVFRSAEQRIADLEAQSAEIMDGLIEVAGLLVGGE